MLSFAAQVAGVCLSSLCRASRVLSCNVLDLSSLLVYHIRDVLHLGVNDFLVRNVDQRHEEGDGGSHEGKPPKRDNLDEPVTQERRGECLKQE